MKSSRVNRRNRIDAEEIPLEEKTWSCINPSRGETSVAYIKLLPNPVGKVTNTSIPLIKLL